MSDSAPFLARVVRLLESVRWSGRRRRGLEAALKAAAAGEARLRAVLQTAPDAIIATSGDGRIQLINSQAEVLFGYSPAELVGQPIEVLLPERLRTAHVAHRQDYQVHPRVRPMGVGLDLMARRKDGSEFPTEISLSPLPTDNGLMVTSVLRDITERRKAEEQRKELLREQAARAEAEAANRAKDEFLAVVSHELRTPLNAILGWAVLLRSKTVDAETSERALAAIERNALAQRQLIDDLLDVSRMVAGKLRLNVQDVDLPVVIEAAVDAVRPAADAKGVRVETIVEAGTPAIWGDPARLQQVFWNLLSNAVKFTQKDGVVEVRLLRGGSMIEIAVSDTGEGISADLLPHVFDRFRQADTSSTRSHTGLGLGLAIVRQVVELHGGSVEAQSAGRNRGATFVVRLPVPAARPHRPAESAGVPRVRVEEAVGPWRLEGVRILAVDDEPEARTVLAAVLADYGAEVTLAGSAEEALTLLERRKPHVLISDVAMPGIDGYVLMARVRTRYPALPAIALTAHATAEDRLRALAAGFQSHVPKPVEPAELAAVVARLVQARTS
jgi:PAS domain S-box-containing protein